MLRHSRIQHESWTAGNLSPFFPLKRCPDIRVFNIRSIFQEHTPRTSGSGSIVFWRLERHSNGQILQIGCVFAIVTSANVHTARAQSIFILSNLLQSFFLAITCKKVHFPFLKPYCSALRYDCLLFHLLVGHSWKNLHYLAYLTHGSELAPI